MSDYGHGYVEAQNLIRELKDEIARLRDGLRRGADWLEDALDRNQIVHERDRRTAGDWVKAVRALLADQDGAAQPKVYPAQPADLDLKKKVARDGIAKERRRKDGAA